jgi:pseudaminic acid synthase
MVFMHDIKIGSKTIGMNNKPFIIAEMSGNHNQSLERALETVKAAAEAGVDALKLQTYTADTMTLNLEEGEFYIEDENSLWNGISLYKLYQQAYTPWEWHKPIFGECKKQGLICFSTPFDETAVAFLEELDVPCYKIASFENTDIPLLKKVAATGKPIFISTGMATLAELDESVLTLRQEGCKDLILLKCTSSYPASPLDSNLATIPNMQELFGTQVGLSDHTLGIGVAIASIAFGATVIEKHFTISRADGGVDSAFSLEPEEFKMLVAESEKAWEAIGSVQYGITETEKDSRKFRRSIYIAKDLKRGDILTKENIRIVRPGYGLAPKYYPLLLGKRVKEEIKRGTPVAWDIIG